MDSFDPSRRSFLKQGTAAAAALMAGAWAPGGSPAWAAADEMRFGLVTYLWGRDWSLPTLIRNCQRTGAMGVELRVEHAHGVGPGLSESRRAEVFHQFESSPVELVGFGTNAAFHYTDEAQVQEAIDQAKEYVVLSHDCGGSGVKVKPNALPDGVPEEQTIEQIGTSLNELARFAADYGQEIRVEVHGSETQRLPIMERIFRVADHPNVGVCWNCNSEDLEGQGLEHNFGLVRNRLSETTHVREFNVGDYPYPELFDLLAGVNYNGWILMEARTEPDDRVRALTEQRLLFEQMVMEARG
ncbi:MAG: TIM barrel protein [Salinibacter sp.]|uniref:sugar phosphate isomerase/epimerase family protein n=1 Tax=Salinibacter sp. TaxID=2065818 RepID=UPI002FC32A60